MSVTWLHDPECKNFAICTDTKNASKKIIIYSIHIVLKAVINVAFVNRPVASTVLYTVITNTMSHAVTAVKNINCPIVFGISFSFPYKQKRTPNIPARLTLGKRHLVSFDIYIHFLSVIV